MRTKAKYFLISLIILMQVSCNEYLDLQPPNGLIRDEFWKTKEDVEAVLMAAYESFSKLDRMLFVFGEVRADLIEGKNNQPWNEQLLMENNIYPDNAICSWADFYKVINYCNEVIQNAPVVREIDNTFTDFQMYSLMSEAYFLRSLSYFYLVRLYRDVPLILEPSESDDADFYLTKSTEDDVLNQIVGDLETNRVYAPSGGFPTIAENKGRASKVAYDALLADIELWRFNYEKVLTHISSIEQNIDIVMMPSARWFEMFYPGNSLESIFEFQFDGDLNQNNGTYGLTQRNSNQYKPSQKALEMFAFEFASEIVRGEDASIKKYGDDDYIVWKYVGMAPDGQTTRTGAEQFSANWIVYRLGDVMLMKAEALSQLERYNEALTIINDIRERANMSLLSLANTRVAFEDAILNERSLELAYEGKRWFDLLRMGRRDNFARKDKLIEVIVSNVPSTQKRILAAKLTNPLGWYLPIYDTEIERNRNLVQNPYYDF
ncbi:MAG TPA: RagB/SusD family nutrient uptake outer membrane protein [Mariniphaga anaerophila]|uniref:RagB/SusD family nutrient uptake outer membrane protein n=1 Tax=Mariniphaga anaerophila TaxID=1484053 RepID=A0A831LP69_9BACT|nr:RagB/SusD family nutrient uptake outer membrane protein [Mariniphaga anaerophila]